MRTRTRVEIPPDGQIERHSVPGQTVAAPGEVLLRGTLQERIRRVVERTAQGTSLADIQDDWRLTLSGRSQPAIISPNRRPALLTSGIDVVTLFVVRAAAPCAASAARGRNRGSRTA